MKRILSAFLMVLALNSLNFSTVLADDVQDTPVSSPETTVEPSPQASSPQGGAGLLLGPATSSSGSQLQSGGGVLQSGASDASGLAAPSDSVLQGSAPSGDLKVLLDSEADGRSGTTATAPDSIEPTLADTVALVLLLGLIGLIFLLRQRVARRFSGDSQNLLG